MKVKLNSGEVEFLKDILQDTEYNDLVSSFVDNQEVEIDDEIADEIRELCADEEVSEAYNAEEQGVSITKRGRIVCDLVDKLFIA